MSEPQPVPPENVRVVVDGREVPVECVYTGRLGCGCALWKAVMPIGLGTDEGAYLAIGMLPAQTEIEVAVVRVYRPL